MRFMDSLQFEMDDGFDSNQGIDLNEDILFVVDPGDDVGDMRRNPHRIAIDRQHHCILMPNPPHD